MRALAMTILAFTVYALSACSSVDPATTREDLAQLAAIESVAAAAREEVLTLESTFDRSLSASEVAALRSVLTSEAGVDPKMYSASETRPVTWPSATVVTMRVAQTKAVPLGLPPVYVSMRWRQDGSGWTVMSIAREAP